MLPAPVAEVLIDTLSGLREFAEDTRGKVATSALAALAIGSALVTASSAASSVSGGTGGFFHALRTLLSSGGLAASQAASGTGGFLQGLRSFFFFAGLRRRQPFMGRTTENRTNRPVPRALVTVLDATGKPRDSMLSRSDGTFGFVLPKGTYRFTVGHAAYTLAQRPEGIVTFPEEELYTGKPFTVTEDEVPAVSFLVVLDPLAGAPRSSLADRLRPWGQRLQLLQTRLAIPVLVVGATLNTVLLFLNPTVLLVAYEILYAVLVAMEVLLSRVFQRVLGRVRNAVTGGPVSLALVRLTDPATRRILGTKVTTPRGQFLLMPPPGRQYQLHVLHPNYLPYTQENVRIGRRVGTTVAVRAHLKPRGTPNGP